jgi:hypothetical protein
MHHPKTSCAIALIVASVACGGRGSEKNEAPALATGGFGGAAVSGAGGTAAETASGGAGGAAGTTTMPAGGMSAGQGGAPGSDASVIDASDASVVTDASTPDTSAPTLPPVDSVEEDGPFETIEDLATGPAGESGMFYPSDLGRDGFQHPILVWGCGGGSRPSSYSTVLHRVASHGFVVIAEVSMIGDDGDVLTATLDWIIAEASRMGGAFNGKLDTTKIAAGGHSIGSVNTFFMAADPRLTTTIHVAGGSLDNVNDPFAPTSGSGGRGLVHPTALICSESDLFGNVEKTELDYQGATAPVFFTIMNGTEHVGAATDGLPAIIAWLRWHLGNEAERRAMFLEASGAFQTGKYATQTKNW